MKMGEITAIQAGSPAAAAGIKPGDRITQIDGGPVGDPMTLPDRLNRRAGKTVELTLERKGEKAPMDVSVRLRQPDRMLAPPTFATAPLAVSSLGVAYHVLNEVERVMQGSPAAKAGMKPGDMIVKAKIIPPDEEALKELDYRPADGQDRLRRETIVKLAGADGLAASSACPARRST